MNGSEVLTGTVSRVNERGLILNDEDCWLNVSRYAKPAPVLPRVGESVRVYLDKDGYVRDVERVPYEVDVPPPEEPSRQVEATRSNGSTALTPDRDLRICRQAVLNTATAILSSGGLPASPDEVLALAERLEAWVGR